MKQYPAIDVRSAGADLVLAIVDDFGPTAAEEGDTSVRIFFSTADDRDNAQRAHEPRFEVAALDVSDEDWARRSQENLKPITVGRIIVTPPWVSEANNPQPSALRIVILPSMGFGTGHHATTRLCLAALQTIDLAGREMLDVGTGSGVLALAADRLGAARAVGIDSDPDATQSAQENLALNPDARHVAFDTKDLATDPLPPADVVTANLTGALLIRSAAILLAAVRPGGTLVLSGIQSHERDEVRAPFAAAPVHWEGAEDGWLAFAVKKS
jgi:ribosomal protein L11 methyltransferase